MRIIVCVKEVSDPEAPAELFKLDPERKMLVAGSKVPRVLNPFDEQAVEAALRIKDKVGAMVIVLTLGAKLDRAVVRKPLSMGADELVLLEDQAFDPGDGVATAQALAAAIRKLGDFDLILTGRQAADWNGGQVGLWIAEELGLPSVTVARRIDIVDTKARVERVCSDGVETVEVTLPALVTVSNELGQARYPTIANIRAAYQIQPVVWKPADLGLDSAVSAPATRRPTLLKLYQPVHDGICEMVRGETVQDAATQLALRLRHEGVL